MTRWASDALCRLSTKGTFQTRALWTNDELITFRAARPIIVNGIDAIPTREDLLDRALVIDLTTIPKGTYKLESDLDAEWEGLRPYVLGAVLDGVSAGIRHYKKDPIPLDRMADFMTRAHAAEEGFGWSKGTFLAAYQGMRRRTQESCLADTPLVEAVVKFLAVNGGTYQGTASDLLLQIEVHRPKYATAPAWPTTPNAVSNKLKRLAPLLRTHEGIDFQKGRGHERYVSLRRVEGRGMRRSEPATPDAPIAPSHLNHAAISEILPPPALPSAGLAAPEEGDEGQDDPEGGEGQDEETDH